MTPEFEQAVAAIDAGDVPALERLLSERPALLRERAQRPEPYFRRPYLLWFVAENPVRNGRLPANIADVARALVDAVRRDGTDSLRTQIDYALALVCSGRVPRESGVQTALIDVLADAGADCTAALGPALAHRERAAVMRLLERGAALTLPAAASLGRIEDVSRLARDAGRTERQAALIVAALDGRAEVVPELLRHGADVDGYGPDGFHPHATALHQAVYTGSLETVKALVDAGASLEQTDAVHGSTPLGWAVHMKRDEIAAYLRTRRDGRRHVLDPRRLAPLFVRPSVFFRDRAALAAGPPAMAAAYLAAVAEVIGTISTRTDPVGAARQAGRLAGGGPETWLGFWAIALVAGALGAVWLWWIGGWWCALRLRWSGADAETEVVRPLYAWASLVYGLPVVSAIAVCTVLYPGPRAEGPGWVHSAMVLITWPWSCVTLYRGVVTLFAVRRGRAAAWFLLLPLAVCLLSGIGGAAYGVLTSSPD